METTEDILSIVVADLYRRGSPVATSPIVRRTYDGADQVVLTLVPLESRVSYVYTRIGRHGETEELEHHVRVVWEPANLGGVRAWLLCSYPGCGRRSGRLFLQNMYLVCRRCAGVPYPSQVAPQPQHLKSVARAKAIRIRLGGDPVLGAPVPPRPKGMHRKNYEPLVAELAEIERSEEDRAIRDGELSLSELLARTLREDLLRDGPLDE